MFRAASVSLSLVALAMGGVAQVPVSAPADAPDPVVKVKAEAIPAPIPAGCQCGDPCDCDGLTEADVRRIVREELAKQQPKVADVARPVVVPPGKPVVAPPAKPATAPVVSGNRRSASELRAIIQQRRPGGWSGAVYADVQPRALAKSHLQSDHGFAPEQLVGLSQNELLILHDLAHGRQVTPYRAVAVSSVRVQSPVVDFGWQQPVQSGCANGRCATPQSAPSTRRFRLFR